MSELRLSWHEAVWEFPVDVCAELQVAYAEKQRGKKIERDLASRQAMMEALDEQARQAKE